MRYRLRIVLLSLGVILGFGSGIAHAVHHHRHGGPWDHGCRHDRFDRGGPPGPPPPGAWGAYPPPGAWPGAPHAAWQPPGAPPPCACGGPDVHGGAPHEPADVRSGQAPAPAQAPVESPSGDSRVR